MIIIIFLSTYQFIPPLWPRSITGKAGMREIQMNDNYFLNSLLIKSNVATGLTKPGTTIHILSYLLVFRLSLHLCRRCRIRRRPCLNTCPLISLPLPIRLGCNSLGLIHILHNQFGQFFHL